MTLLDGTSSNIPSPGIAYEQFGLGQTLKLHPGFRIKAVLVCVGVCLFSVFITTMICWAVFKRDCNGNSPCKDYIGGQYDKIVQGKLSTTLADNNTFQPGRGVMCVCSDGDIVPSCDGYQDLPGVLEYENAAALTSGAKCTASSEYSPSYVCEKALDGRLVMNGGEWASKGEGEGAWFEVVFASPYLLNHIRIMQRVSQRETFENLALTFSGGVRHEVTLLRSPGQHSSDSSGKIWNEFPVPHVVTDRVRIDALSAYSTINNGFVEIEVYGVSCETVDKKDFPNNSTKYCHSIEEYDGNDAPYVPDGYNLGCYTDYTRAECSAHCWRNTCCKGAKYQVKNQKCCLYTHLLHPQEYMIIIT